uniref:Uncharacterized protein n=1 Tax=Pseudomonas fluorescens TaxID=294 RepID=A0A5E6XFB7_PSEFL|nr:hypothetical protein PS652_05370 [Pseudomonas fluorescens]
MPGNLGTVQATQAGGDIGQQQGGQPIAAGNPGQAAKYGENTQLQRQASQQGGQADATGAQVANQAAALFEGQANGGVGDEQPDDEGQQAQRREVEVKTVGQALKVAVVAGCLQGQALGDVCRQRPGLFAQQQSRQLSGCLQQRLRVADIHHDHPRCQLRLDNQRRQYLAVTADRLPVGIQPQLPQGIGADPGLSGRADECLQVEPLQRSTGDGHCRWQAQRLDTDQPYCQRLLPGKAQATFQHRRQLPAERAQLQVQRLREALTAARHQLRLRRPGQHGAGAGVVGPGLAVERLHSGP